MEGKREKKQEEEKGASRRKSREVEKEQGLSGFCARAAECPEILDARWALGSKLKRQRL